MNEVPRWLELQAEIDYLHWVFGVRAEQLGLTKPRSPIEVMIDEATGYDAELRELAQEIVDKRLEFEREIG